MTKGQKLGLFIVGALILIGGGLYSYYKYNLKKLEELKTKIKDVKVKATFKKINIRGKVEITNPSQLNIFIEKYNIDIYIQGVFVANFSNDSANMPINANSVLVFPFNVDVDTAKLTENLLSVVMAVFVNKTKPQTIDILYKGTISGKQGAISVNDFPIDYLYKYNPTTEEQQ